MQVTQEQIAALLKLQAIDSECARLNKQLDELPQKMAILDVRHKKAALAEKRRTIVGMHKDTQTQLAHAEGEDADLARKSKVAQGLIDTAGGDYRSITLHSKELSGYQKRRDTLVDEIAVYKEKLAQMEKLEGEIDTIEASLCAKEKKLIAEYRAKGGEILARVNQFKPERDRMVAFVNDSKLLATYERIAKAKGGVALSALNENTCTVCRMTFDHSRVLGLRAESPLSVCPSCGRLMVVDKKYRG